ncbi:hypothetical protein U5922_002790 [Aquicoccus sp. G2-2]|uniref:hypothetical protein n=1 Tax=Aquicoccus sp. G2-2 TaxID=3092120 RepID=UPI002ADFA990|nr:hypothetical protein [Aquicoccus sp. G2-2]MEA1112447.1 hypothetical protein [Aquicoccus sp. G2-2]
MDEISIIRLWLARAGFVALVLALLFFRLLPLETSPHHWAGPDLVLSFLFAWGCAARNIPRSCFAPHYCCSVTCCSAARRGFIRRWR